MTRLLFGILILVGCASSSKCPDAISEPVSVCRAETACGKGSFKTGLALFLGGAAGSGRNTASDQYNSCVDRNLGAQRANVGMPQDSQTCETEKTGDDHYRTVCH